MLKIWSLKQKQQQAENAAGGANAKNKVTAGKLRVQHDLTALEKDFDQHQSAVVLDFPNKEDQLHFNLTLNPDEGMYKGGSFKFTFDIDDLFPYHPPKVKCTQKLYHPNIEPQGNVCLNILREDWRPVLDLRAVVFGLLHLFLEPNASDPLNKEAAEDLRVNREGFKRNVRTAMQGGSVRNVQYDRVMR
ncbi:NEDD8-conjugating protein ubc12 [Onygenales sp. PD_40]|nr:NEDD8-conjugating protein ubc12 [Onygenales sp. PD_40]KAK2779210.1 NEDD8-conjugating protein ubc12 [Onygenales sp. PD_12]KAK2786073.1 NEDD8-conjugating protein ubc12 [Emmonsiellopsis sp. PD_33]KAK2799219.1 NEDD8-conjugating protein ubc12 [Onygenales sp. PD_10]